MPGASAVSHGIHHVATLKFFAFPPIFNPVPPESEIAAAIEHLRATTVLLSPSTDGGNLDQIQSALSARQIAVERLNRLLFAHPKSFTSADLDSIRASHSAGKRALEKILELRRRGWTTSTRLSQSEYVMRSFAQFGSGGHPLYSAKLP